MRLFDSHSHINDPAFDADRAQVIERMRQAGLVGALVVGCDYGEETKLFEILDDNPDFLIGAWALHPEYEDRRESTVEEIVAIASESRPSARRAWTITGARETSPGRRIASRGILKRLRLWANPSWCTPAKPKAMRSPFWPRTRPATWAL